LKYTVSRAAQLFGKSVKIEQKLEKLGEGQNPSTIRTVIPFSLKSLNRTMPRGAAVYGMVRRPCTTHFAKLASNFRQSAWNR
jgi:hypothetical protein